MIKDFRPNLLPEIRDIELRAKREVLSRNLSGNWLSTFKGQGLEFSHYRKYLPTDDASRIDWRASLRAQKLLVKELTEDRNLNVFLVLDVSASMAFGSKDKLKAEFAAQVASSIAYAALRAGDAVGMLMFAQEIRKYIEPNIGMGQHHHIVGELSKAEHYGGGFDIGKSLLQIMQATKQRGMIVLISDYIGLPEKWNSYVQTVAGKFDIVGVMVRDPRDRRLPKRAGEYALEDPYTGEKIVIDCKTYYKPYAEYVKKEEDAIRGVFNQIDSDLVVLETDDDFMRKLMHFFHRRSKQVASA